MRNRIRKILKENSDELGNWFNEIEPTFKNWNFEFDGKHEYWVDLTKMTKDEISVVADYILKCLPNISGLRKTKFKNLGDYDGVVIHCGSEDNDYYPTENYVCFMEFSFDDDEEKNNSIYIDGREVYEYIKIKEEQNLKESLNWSDKDTINWDKDPNWGTDNYYGPDTNNWTTDTAKSQWVQGDGGGVSKSSEDTMSEEDEIEFGDDFDWAKNTGVQPNYNGHPQGVVYLRDHDEIDEFCDIIETYNGGELPRGNVRENLHSGLENSRDELEGSDYDPSNAVISVSFFVEKNKPSLLSVGYWGYDVADRSIFEWLEDGDTFNNEYELYTNLNQVKKVFEDYQNPELVKESTDPEWEWLNDVPVTIPFEMVELHKKYKIEVKEDLRDAIESCGDNSRIFVQGYYGVVTKTDTISYNRIHCDSEIEDEVFTLQLYFYDIDDNKISYFWVSSNMVDFYEI
jgi:hypothetical protein